MKVTTYCWTNGKKSWLGLFGTKYGLAWDLLVGKDIRLTKKDLETFDIKSNSTKHIATITAFKAAKILESKGWWWERQS